MDISNYKFGDNYRGEQMVWEFIFEPETPEAISVKTLNEDFNLIPMLTQLDETINKVMVCTLQTMRIIPICYSLNN